MSGRGGPREWERARREHARAVDALIARIESIAPERWGEPAPAMSWTPAQIAEHLALTYEAGLRELSGEGAMHLRLTPLRRRLLRWFLLPHMLFHRTLPIRAVAPREVRPGEAGADQREIVPRLRELARTFEAEISRAGDSGGGLTLPYFGVIPPLRTLRFVTVHLEHHTRQLPGGAGDS